MTGSSQLAQLLGSPSAVVATAEGDSEAEGVGSGSSNGTHPANSGIAAARDRSTIDGLRVLRPVVVTMNPFNDVCPNLHGGAL